MSIIVAVATWSMVAFSLLFFMVQMLAREFGYLCGRRSTRKAELEGVGILVGGMLGLMAFVLAMTLSFTNARFEERRAGTLAEANAIGTAWLRAQAIDHPRAAEIGRLLEEYTAVRRAFVEAPRDQNAIAAINQKTSSLQNEMWGHFTALMRERVDPITAGFMNALNDTFDMTTAERFAFDLVMPQQLFWLLVGMALLGMAGVGYQLGLKGNPYRLLSTLLTAMWTIVIVGILDLAAPRVGTMSTGTSAYDWTIQGFKGGITIPPPPRPH